MRDINHDVAALECCYRIVGGQPVAIDDNHRYDLARILIDLYDVSYIGRPRLERFVEKRT